MRAAEGIAKVKRVRLVRQVEDLQPGVHVKPIPTNQSPSHHHIKEGSRLDPATAEVHQIRSGPLHEFVEFFISYFQGRTAFVSSGKRKPETRRRVLVGYSRGSHVALVVIGSEGRARTNVYDIVLEKQSPVDRAVLHDPAVRIAQITGPAAAAGNFQTQVHTGSAAARDAVGKNDRGPEENIRVAIVSHFSAPVGDIERHYIPDPLFCTQL